jgi:hypothetical protein
MNKSKLVLISLLIAITFTACKKSDNEESVLITIANPFGGVSYITVSGETRILIEMYCDSINCSEPGIIIDYKFILKKGDNTVLTIRRADLPKYKMKEFFNEKLPGGKIAIVDWAFYGELMLPEVPELQTRPDNVVLWVQVKTEAGKTIEKTSEPGQIIIADGNE